MNIQLEQDIKYIVSLISNGVKADLEVKTGLSRNEVEIKYKDYIIEEVYKKWAEAVNK